MGGLWRSEPLSYECVCVACVYCVFVCTYMYVCLFVCLFVYEWYVCVISVVSALSAGVGGVWRVEAGSYDCVCVCVCYVCVLCVCVYMYVCVFVCLFLCVRVLRVYDISCVCSL